MAKARKSRKRSGSPTFKSAVYAFLCVALIALIGWRWWSYEQARLPTPSLPPPFTNVVAKPISVPARPLPEMVRTDARPVRDMLEAQIALARLGISCGSIDGVGGAQTRAALIAFQTENDLSPTGTLSAETKAALLVTPPIATTYTITSNDLARILPLPKTWLEKSEQPRLDYPNIVELLGEKSFAHPNYIRALNPGMQWSNVLAGTQVILPQVEYPVVATKAATIKIWLQSNILEAFDSDDNLLAHFPCSIGRLAEKRPVGELHVVNIALNPNYTFDPAVFPESPEAQQIDHKLIIPPGPRNPVGTAWIGLDRPGYGIHGTPVPEKVGRTESHGCFRLANWNAEYLARLVWIGLPVKVQ